ncbi:hypothetical protein H8R29_11355 [Priestia megaterium]|uniref:DUF3168 domain-containing protein n=1 Tax=Priestia megaterium (strain ATCC 14581 / DSM 32 / CCUG 1817 / JCM 2506 / NBRC 15308 / NCIMB 9376 / NCTC 10342 / NRRL B-14308 / VKM B-512 / Ford 19) TaxID=1348623 RepID=A0A0B6AAQ5_PRIM2|nr:hypothetical protein [Priestia megaterium]AJI22005.1 hypothetical protein BG04_4558 [Priestia megaterium NBRC 15308 = ATCC 14581]KFM98248.1 hypothetical protein DJ91_711 [Priestia megaterium]KGJ73850.1 hypothetical protein BMT_05535 [Priestia megaterium NBRC 15308 = ATCC 14581]MDR4231314.1 hypothetical protein [Priestia megaterium]MED3807580.1 hypothetical protein [Priestia megaterium]
MLYKVYDVLNTSDLIKEKVGKQIKFYKYPSTDNMQGVYIVIDPIDVPKPGDYADNKWLTDEYFYQIEVWSMNLFDTQAVAKEVRNVMWNELGFAQLIPGLDEFDEDTGIYRDARRYRGKEYVEI